MKATIRVRSGSDVEGQRPEPAQMERAAELLQQSGFEVLRVGRYGVNIEGDEQAFKRELGVDTTGNTLVTAPQAHHEELSQLIDLVEVTGKPLSFNE